jgi:hypothetical protein
MKLSKHQTKLLALIKQHQPVVVQSQREPIGPKFMLDGTIWANLLATEALIHKRLVQREPGTALVTML